MPIVEIRPGRPRVTIAQLMGLIAVVAVAFGTPRLMGYAFVLVSFVAVVSAVIALARGERLTAIEWFVAASGSTVLISLLLPRLS